jgi:Zn-dependent protease with chaperone function
MNQELIQKPLIHKNEKFYFSIALIVSMISYAALILSVIGIIIVTIFIAFPLFFHALMMAHIRSNGVRLSPQQFPKVYEKIKELCEKMEIAKVPDVYVMESSGILNAFATRFFGRNMVVLYSDIFDLINSGGDEELSFVIAHELAHIKRNHIGKRLLILPAMWIPLVGEAYSRSCEYTCDRMAAYYTGNSEAAMNGLTILAIGKILYRQVDRSEYLYQSSEERGFFVWLMEKLSTHPTLPKRINEIEIYMENTSSGLFKSSSKMVWLWSSAACIIAVMMIIGISYAVDTIDTLADSDPTGEVSSEGVSDLIKATAEGDLEGVRKLLESGVDPDIRDSDGWTALMWASQDNNVEIINLLITAGADPNVQDYNYAETALTKAISQNNIEAFNVLLGSGVDPNLQDNYGWTALMSAASYGDMEMVQSLLKAGADPNIEDYEKMTAFMHAKKGGYKETAELLRP